jgi:hypothetical protein
MLKLRKKPQPKGSTILKLLDNIMFARFEWKVLAKLCILANITGRMVKSTSNARFHVKS